MSNYTEFGIFMHLLDGKIHTAKELADKFEVSIKTIYRQANKLVYAGYPITTLAGKNGGICIAEKFKCQTWFFSEEELAYIQNIIVSNASIDPIKSSIICNKIAEHIKNQNFVIANKNINKLISDSTNWFSKDVVSISFCKDYLNACVNNTKIKILYDQNETERIIDPYCIVQKEGNYYLYAFCNNKKQFRLFKISKIITSSFLTDKFVPQDIDLAQKPWNTPQNKIKIKIKTSTSVAQDISLWTSCNNDCADTYTLEANDNKGLIHKLMQYGSSIRVLSPQKIISDMLAECKFITDLYSN